MPSETPQFFPNRDRKRLFSILHEPTATGVRRDFAVVYCAPLFEEKLWSHRVAVNFARFMTSLGVAVLRFDYFGDGESEGSFEDASVASRIRDVLDAAEFCRQQTQVETISLVGLCYGATLAVCAAPLAPEISAAVAWAPVMDGRRYIQDILRAHLTAQLVLHRRVVHDREALVAQIQAGQTVNVEGYEIGKALYTEMLDIDLRERLRSSAKSVLVQQIAPGEALERPYTELPHHPNRLVEFQKIRENRFWLQQKNIFPPCDALFRQTADWLMRSVSR